MRILITNDDGVHAEGLAALANQLSRQHRVVVVAPDRERSAISHAITLQTPLRIFSVENGCGKAYAVNGTPADCVKIAMLEILEQAPDLVVSGINPGPNVGLNLHYSGTVAGAREAAIRGIPALAVSMARARPSHWDTAAAYSERLAGQIHEKGLGRGIFLNVNVPDEPMGKIRGARLCSQGQARLEEAFHKRSDPRNQAYYWQGSETQLFGDSDREDGVALAQGYISITPVNCDMTAHDFFGELEQWSLGTS